MIKPVSGRKADGARARIAVARVVFFLTSDLDRTFGCPGLVGSFFEAKAFHLLEPCLVTSQVDQRLFWAAKSGQKCLQQHCQCP